MQYALKPIQPDYNQGLYIRAFNSIFSGTGKLLQDEGRYISRTEYPNGYALYAFDLTNDMGDKSHLNLIKEGNVRLGLKFRQRLEETVTMVCYAKFENLIEVDRNRNVIFDFGV